MADYDRAIELDPEDAMAYYNRACAHARMGEANKACSDLTQAIALDHEWLEAAHQDQDFDSIRSQPCFQALLAANGD